MDSYSEVPEEKQETPNLIPKEYALAINEWGTKKKNRYAELIMVHGLLPKQAFHYVEFHNGEIIL